MKILIACEFTGIVRDAFTAKGHDVTSCDLLPTERPGKHYQGDFMDIINDGWDMMIAHPPCTYLCNSGVRWFKNKDKSISVFRGLKAILAMRFFMKLKNAQIEKIAIENPIPHKYAKNGFLLPYSHVNHKDGFIESFGHIGIGDYSQIVQPWMFGHGETKATCLWLKGLPKLKPTDIVEGREQRIWKMPPSKDRAKERSRTLSGFANAMADQWG